jgi:serine/threonine-protein kinase
VGDSFQENSIIAGKYLLGRELRSSGHAPFMEATYLPDGSQRALSLWQAEPLEDSRIRGRFEREVRLGPRLTGGHFLRVIETGQLDSGARYIAYERLEGQSLAEIIEARGQLPPQQAVDWILQACEGVAELHKIGIIHRALCPRSLFVSEPPGGPARVHVIDFCTIKDTDPEAEELTDEIDILGIPLYMSPEQLRSSRDVDAGTDIWALGATLYEMLAGRQPFLAETMPELCMAIVSDPPPPLRSFCESTLVGLEPVVLKALEKDASKRWPTVARLARALDYFSSARSARPSGALHP